MASLSWMSRLRSALAWIACAGLAAGAGAAEPEPARPAPHTWYAQAVALGDGVGVNITHFWSKGPWLRAETVVAGHRLVTIVRGATYYAYDSLTGEGLAIARQPEAIARQEGKARPFGNQYETLIAQGAEKVREEQLLGRSAGVYRVTDELGKRELWVTEDPERIPLRIRIFERNSGRQRTTDFIDWQSDFHIPDDFFEPDPRARLEALDYREYLRRSAEEGTVGPVPVLYTPLLFAREGD